MHKVLLQKDIEYVEKNGGLWINAYFDLRSSHLRNSHLKTNSGLNMASGLYLYANASLIGNLDVYSVLRKRSHYKPSKYKDLVSFNLSKELIFRGDEENYNPNGVMSSHNVPDRFGKDYFKYGVIFFGLIPELVRAYKAEEV